MDAKDIIASVTDKLKQTANVDVVFGSPVEASGLTIIPVACVRITGGGGGGSGPARSQDSDDEPVTKSSDMGNGMGLGLHVTTTPIGYIEVIDGEARFVDIVDKNKLAVGGVVIGGLLLLTAAKLLSWKIKHR